MGRGHDAANRFSPGTVRFDAAEAHLVLRLVAEDSLRSSAKAPSIGYETARTTLKSVFQKTGTCRQAELVIVIIHAMNRMR